MSTPGRAGQLAQLVDVDLQLAGAAAGGDRHEDGALAVADPLCAGVAREGRLALADPRLEVEVDQGRGLWVETLDARVAVPRFAVAGGPEGGGVGERGQALVVHAHRDHRVEAQQQQIGPVVPRQPLATRGGVWTQRRPRRRPRPARRRPQSGRAMEWGVAHHHLLDEPAAVEEHADLTTDLVADLGELPGELLGDEPVRGDPAPEQALELAGLARLEAVRVAEDFDGKCLQSGRCAARISPTSTNQPGFATTQPVSLLPGASCCPARPGHARRLPSVLTAAAPRRPCSRARSRGRPRAPRRTGAKTWARSRSARQPGHSSAISCSRSIQRRA